MWTCPKCGENHDDKFDSCWKCAGPATSLKDVNSGRVNSLSCLRCNTALEHLGTKSFHEGRRWGFLGELGELFVNREHFDIYACPLCGKVEFFVDGVGEEFRSE